MGAEPGTRRDGASQAPGPLGRQRHGSGGALGPLGRKAMGAEPGTSKEPGTDGSPRRVRPTYPDVETLGNMAPSRRVAAAMKKLRQLDDDLWVVDVPVRLLGVELGGRMTVVRLSGGGLWLHSPVRIDDELAAELRELGPVTDLVAPNRFHHLHLPRAQRLFPDARSHAAPGLTAKRSDITFTAKLSQPAPEPWSGSLESLVFDAAPAMGEVVFLHRPSRTLILCDLCFNEPAGGGIWGELVCRLNGARRGLAPTRTVRFVLKDRRRARELVDQILQWDFDRVTVTHGSVVDSGGHAAFADAFRFLPAA